MNAEAIDMKELKEAVKALNDTGEVDPKIKVVGTKKEKLIELFIENLETLNDNGVDLPTVSIEFYNALPEDEETDKGSAEEPKEKEEEPGIKGALAGAALRQQQKGKKPKGKKAPAKKETKKKDEKKPKEKSDPVQRKETKKDEFGFTVGCQANLFAKAIKKKMMTMAEVKELDWNEKGRTFYDVFNKLVEEGFAVKDEKSGKMKMVKK